MDNLQPRHSTQGNRLRSTLQNSLHTATIKPTLSLVALIWEPDPRHHRLLWMLLRLLWVVLTRGYHHQRCHLTIEHLQPNLQITAPSRGNVARGAIWTCTAGLHKSQILKFNSLNNLHTIQKTMQDTAATPPRQLLLHFNNLSLNEQVIQRLIKHSKICLL